MKPTDPLGRAGTLGAVIAAVACPVCFPKIALVGAWLGLGAFAAYEGIAIIIVQILFAIAFAAQILGYRRHRRVAPLAFSAFVTLSLFAGLYVIGSPWVLQASIAGLVLATIWQGIALRRPAAPHVNS